MLVFGHVGVTIGVARLVDIIMARLPSTNRDKIRPANLDLDTRGAPSFSLHKVSLLPLRQWLDYRLLAVAGLLPDIIDKPLGMLILRNQISFGRIFSHTMLFVLVIGLIGFYLFRRKGQAWLFTLAIGSLAHVMEDELWRNPSILLWPLYGLFFGRTDVDPWLGTIIYGLFHKPKTYISEIVGFLIVVYLGIEVLRRKCFKEFWRTGHIP